MPKKAPIENNEKVLVFFANGTSKNYIFRDLKNDFMQKKITVQIHSVYSIRKQQKYFCKYQPTKGFTFEKIGGKEKL